MLCGHRKYRVVGKEGMQMEMPEDTHPMCWETALRPPVRQGAVVSEAVAVRPAMGHVLGRNFEQASPTRMTCQWTRAKHNDYGLTHTLTPNK